MGGLYDIQLNSSWYIQPQLIFSYEVDRAKYLSGKKVSDDLDVSTSMYSLTLPVLASFKVSLNDYASMLDHMYSVLCSGVTAHCLQLIQKNSPILLHGIGVF